MGEMRNIMVVSYDPLWVARFHAEAALLSAIFGEELISIHHIGSTAVPGLSAKPVLDIMPVVRDIEKIDKLNPAMIAAGYGPQGEYGIRGRRFFAKGGDATRTHHVHVYQTGHAEVARHLVFRDYLIAHSEEARAYAVLKAALAEQHTNDIDVYMRGKDPFIKATLEKAHRWRDRIPA